MASRKPAPKKSAPKKRATRRSRPPANAGEIVRRLLAHYPDTGSALVARSPFELLAATILSAQCTDAQVNKITPALFARYPDAPAMAAADADEVRRLIHSTGFFNQKTKSLLSMARDLVERHGGAVPGTMEELTRLRGVGRKTAWCVLGAFFDQPGHIVDTHFERVTRRLGLHREEDPVKIEKALDAIVPQPERGRFSHAIIVHGRQVCAARTPKCGECFLADLCPSAVTA